MKQELKRIKDELERKGFFVDVNSDNNIGIVTDGRDENQPLPNQGEIYEFTPKTNKYLGKDGFPIEIEGLGKCESFVCSHPIYEHTTTEGFKVYFDFEKEFTDGTCEITIEERLQ